MKQWQDIWSERCTVLAAVQSSVRQLELEAIPTARTCLQAGIDKVQQTFECEPCCQLHCCQASGVTSLLRLSYPVNEAQYQLTVRRMGELKEAHEVQAALQHKHHVVRESRLV